MSTPSPFGMASKIARAIVLFPEPDPPAMPRNRGSTGRVHSTPCASPERRLVLFENGVEAGAVDVAAREDDDEIAINR